MRRLFSCLVLVAVGGCRSVEVAVTYPLAGVHVVAKFEAGDRDAPAAPDEDAQKTL